MPTRMEKVKDDKGNLSYVMLDGTDEILIDVDDYKEAKSMKLTDTVIRYQARKRKRNDTVNHPSHYNYGDIEVIDFIEQVTQHYNANVAYHIGNAIKYLARSPHKNGKEDIAKAKWYIERAFENWDVK